MRPSLKTDMPAVLTNPKTVTVTVLTHPKTVTAAVLLRPKTDMPAVLTHPENGPACRRRSCLSLAAADHIPAGDAVSITGDVDCCGALLCSHNE